MAVVLVAYAAVSLFHHVHNAEFLDEYPNLPAWLSRGWVYGAWMGAAAVGVIGYLLLCRGYRIAALLLLATYACYGLDGLAHYLLAPLSAHTLAMNLSIWLEAVTAAGLLLALAKRNLCPL